MSTCDHYKEHTCTKVRTTFSEKELENITNILYPLVIEKDQ